MALNLNKPLVVEGKSAVILHRFAKDRVAVLVDGENTISTFQKYPLGWYDEGRAYTRNRELTNGPVEKVYTLDIYPTTGVIYRRDERRCNPCQSSYPDMFSVIVTERDGVVVKREFI